MLDMLGFSVFLHVSPIDLNTTVTTVWPQRKIQLHEDHSFFFDSSLCFCSPLQMCSRVSLLGPTKKQPRGAIILHFGMMSHIWTPISRLWESFANIKPSWFEKNVTQNSNNRPRWSRRCRVNSFSDDSFGNEKNIAILPLQQKWRQRWAVATYQKNVYYITGL